MNYGKLAMLHRMAGAGPITIYASDCKDDLQTLYNYLQELCSHSEDLKLAEYAIVTRNPFLAHHLKEVIEKQTMVPPSKNLFRGNSLVII